MRNLLKKLGQLTDCNAKEKKAISKLKYAETIPIVLHKLSSKRTLKSRLKLLLMSAYKNCGNRHKKLGENLVNSKSMSNIQDILNKK
jgi:hypothetical protein